MDRRDFLKLFAITAAGVYIPTKSYFFVPKPHIVPFRSPSGNLISDGKSLQDAYNEFSGGFLIPAEMHTYVNGILIDKKPIIVYDKPDEML